MKPTVLAASLFELTLAACNAERPPTNADATAPATAARPAAAPIADQPAQDVPPATASPATTPAADADAPTADTGLDRMDGYGDMRFGMTSADAKAAWGGELEGKADDPQGCHYLRPKWVKTPSDFGFMFEGDKFVRYDTTLAKETAPGGGKVGMQADEIASLYGARVQSAPHKYVDGGKTLTIADDAGGQGRLVFETDATGKVTAWHVGIPPQVDYVERCG